MHQTRISTQLALIWMLTFLVLCLVAALVLRPSTKHQVQSSNSRYDSPRHRRASEICAEDLFPAHRSHRLEHVPLDTPVIFVLNHPNALVDPVFLLCLAPRRVSFLAKAPLFRMPVIGYLVKALDSLPVYRRQDEGEDVTKNQETFVAARKLLARGGTIGICPEGVSHDEPGLRPIKTGAARISLAAVSTGEVSNLKIVPAGLYYTSKTSFRSDALLYFGNPIDVEPVTLEPTARHHAKPCASCRARLKRHCAK